MTCSLYVDDFLICYRGKNMNVIERQLQLNLNKLHQWTLHNGFKFSQSKTVCMHFCQLRTLHNEPDLYIGNTAIKVVKETKFLGLIFDNKLNFKPHIKMIKEKCLKALNSLKVVSRLSWGGESTTLLHLYKALVRSKLDYGCIIYGSARTSYLKTLDTVHHQGLRLSLGAFRTSPIISLYALTKESSLEDRRTKLSMQYFTKLSSNKNNTAYNTIFRQDNTILYETKPNAIKPFGIRIRPYIDSANIEYNNIAQFTIPDTPPWILQSPEIILDLTQYKKENTMPNLYVQKFFEILENFPEYSCIYTDGSKCQNKVASAAVSGRRGFASRLPDNCSIFTAELTAILMALDNIQYFNKDKIMICSDSKSSLEAMKNKHFENPLVLKILDQCNILSKKYEISFCWIPGHVGIKGNEKADRAAKYGLNGQIRRLFIPYTDTKPMVAEYIKRKLQRLWNEQEHNKLHEIFPNISKTMSFPKKTRKGTNCIDKMLHWS